MSNRLHAILQTPFRRDIQSEIAYVTRSDDTAEAGQRFESLLSVSKDPIMLRAETLSARFTKDGELVKMLVTQEIGDGLDSEQNGD